MNDESAKRLLFFFEKLDMDRFKRDNNIPLTVSINPEKAVALLWRWGEFSLYTYLNAHLGLHVPNLVGKTDTEILIEQGCRPAEVTLWVQFYDSEGKKIQRGAVNQIPISSMTTNHIRACLNRADAYERFNNCDLLKEELKYRGKR